MFEKKSGRECSRRRERKIDKGEYRIREKKSERERK